MGYGSGTNTANNVSTGDNNIDGLLADTRWASTRITYSFTNNFDNDYEDELGYQDSDAHRSSFSSLNDAQKTATRDWMEMYDNVSNLDLTELKGNSDRNATIRLAESDVPPTAFAYYPNSFFAEGGDVWLNRFDYNNPDLGSYAFHTLGHELGHSFGLKHGQEECGVRDVAMDSNRDSMEFSIMTYRSYENAPLNSYQNEFWGYAQSLMTYDIRAIQEMYGADFGYNSGNTVYTFSPNTGEMFVNNKGQGKPGENRLFRTVWDGNGRDTYNFSGYTTDLAINLTPGGWSDLDTNGNFQKAYLGNGNYARGHVFNALQFEGNAKSLIENSNGGSGKDSIQGNIADNILRGNDGDDTLTGGAGRDRLNGGSGDDRLNGSSGDDVLIGEDGRDYFIFDTGNTFNDSDLGMDRIVDFSVSEDKIRLSKNTFRDLNNTSNGNLLSSDFEVVESYADAKISSAEIVYNSRSGDLFYNQNNGGDDFGSGDLFARLSGSPDNLSHTDFQIVDV